MSKRAIERYGTTEGCPACNIIKKRRITKGRLGVHHNDQCRKRITTEIKDDPQYKLLVQRSQGRLETLQNVVDDSHRVRTIPREENSHCSEQPTQQWQREEQRGHVRKAIQQIKQKTRGTVNNVSSQLDKIMFQLMVSAMDVAEFYSPPRIAEMAARMGLRAGWSLDLNTQDSDGRWWDFNNKEMRNRAVRRILTDKPLLLIGSPMCTIHSAMNNINHAKMPRQVVQERFEYARRHLQFATQLYQLQIQGGRYFLHEHPQSASSWQEQCIQEVSKLKGVQKVIGDQCRYGQRARGVDGDGPARKATGFMTNSPCIALQLQRRCPNRKGYPVHQHVQLDGGKAKAAQVYPPGFCKAICQGLIERIQADQNGQ